MTKVTFVIDRGIAELKSEVNTLPFINEHVFLKAFPASDLICRDEKARQRLQDYIWEDWTAKGFIVTEKEWTYTKTEKGYYSETCKIYLDVA